MLRRIVGNRFQVLFHSPPGVLFIFPSRYSSAIGHQGVFRLTGWSRQIHSKFHELAATRENNPNHTPALSRTGLSPTTATLSRGLPLTPCMASQARQSPHGRIPQHPSRNTCRLSHDQGLATSAFARHYSRNHNCFLFLWVLRCFTSPRSPRRPMNSAYGDAP